MNTPRTEENRIPNSDLSDWGVGLSNYVELEFSRNLELELNEAKAAIKSAYWQLLPFLKPGDEKTKAVLEQLQKFL